MGNPVRRLGPAGVTLRRVAIDVRTMWSARQWANPVGVPGALVPPRRAARPSRMSTQSGRFPRAFRVRPDGPSTVDAPPSKRPSAGSGAEPVNHLDLLEDVVLGMVVALTTVAALYAGWRAGIARRRPPIARDDGIQRGPLPEDRGPVPTAQWDSTTGVSASQRSKRGAPATGRPRPSLRSGWMNREEPIGAIGGPAVSKLPRGPLPR